MKFPLLSCLAACLVLGGGAGCSHVDLAAEGSRARVIRGTVGTGVALPAGTEILVRIIAIGGPGSVRPAGADLPVAREQVAAAETILAEQVQTLAAPAGGPVPFQIELDAEDAVLRRGVNIVARVFYGGRVRFRTINAHVVTLNSAHFPQTVTLQAVDR